MIFDISTPTKHETRTSIKSNLFPEIYYKNVKFSVFTLQCTKFRENYDCKLMNGVMKAKKVNVGETEICTILGEINPEVQTRRQNVAVDS